VCVQFATLTELPAGGDGLAAVDGGSVAVCGGLHRHRFVFTSRSNHVQLRVVPSVETRFLLRFEGWLLHSCSRYSILLELLEMAKAFCCTVN